MSALHEIIARTHTLFLDFDGPVCSVFAGYPPEPIADKLRTVIEDQGVAVAGELATTDDPTQVLRLVGALGDLKLSRIVSDAMRDHEVHAIATAEPTPGANAVILAAIDSGRRLAVVSNNAVEAVLTYLDAYDLRSSFVTVSARSMETDLSELKPNPALVRHTIASTGTRAEHCALVGDTTTDVVAAAAAKVASIGYANRPGMVEAFSSAGAGAIITDMLELADALARSPLA